MRGSCLCFLPYPQAHTLFDARPMVTPAPVPRSTLVITALVSVLLTLLVTRPWHGTGNSTCSNPGLLSSGRGRKTGKVMVFQHIFAINNYREVVQDQVRAELGSAPLRRCYGGNCAAAVQPTDAAFALLRGPVLLSSAVRDLHRDKKRCSVLSRLFRAHGFSSLVSTCTLRDFRDVHGDVRQVTKILFSGLYHAADAVYSTVSGEAAAEVDAAVELFSRHAGRKPLCRR